MCQNGISLSTWTAIWQKGQVREILKKYCRAVSPSGAFLGFSESRGLVWSCPALRAAILQSQSGRERGLGGLCGVVQANTPRGAAITHYFVSTNLVIWSDLFFAMEMFIVPMTGRAFWNPSLHVTDPLRSRGSSEGMLGLQIPRFIVFLNPKIRSM